MIWKEVSLQPGFVTVEMSRIYELELDGKSMYRVSQYQETIATWKMPAILQVSWESRTVGLEDYALSFGTPAQTVNAIKREDYNHAINQGDQTVEHSQNWPKADLPAKSPKTYVNWVSDLVRLDWTNWAQGNNGNWCQYLQAFGPIKRLAFPEDRLFPDLAATPIDFLLQLDEVVIYIRPVNASILDIKSLEPLRVKGRRFFVEGKPGKVDPITRHYQSKLWQKKSEIEQSYIMAERKPKITFAWAMSDEPSWEPVRTS